MTDLLRRLRERKLGQWAFASAAGAWVMELYRANLAAFRKDN